MFTQGERHTTTGTTGTASATATTNATATAAATGTGNSQKLKEIRSRRGVVGGPIISLSFLFEFRSPPPHHTYERLSLQIAKIKEN